VEAESLTDATAAERVQEQCAHVVCCNAKEEGGRVKEARTARRPGGRRDGGRADAGATRARGVLQRHSPRLVGGQDTADRLQVLCPSSPH
jgi:hypothetical protein